ncbi:MAG: FtsW/RodA/SpoVE family cell cycle protein, partial [Syntrophomonas sp.]
MELKRLKFMDRTFVSVLIILISFGLVVLSSATAASTTNYLSKQIGAFVLGIIVAIFVIRYDYIQLQRYSWALYGISIALLILVLTIGSEVRGTTGWIKIGPLPQFQPAEFTKIMFILAFADFLSKRKGSLNTFKEMLPCFLYMGVPWALVMAQKDLGTGLVYIVITLVMMYFAGANP